MSTRLFSEWRDELRRNGRAAMLTAREFRRFERRHKRATKRVTKPKQLIHNGRKP